MTSFSLDNRDQIFEFKVYEICSSFIVQKIVLEFIRAKDNNYLVQQKGFAIYNVVYK